MTSTADAKPNATPNSIDSIDATGSTGSAISQRAQAFLTRAERLAAAEQHLASLLSAAQTSAAQTGATQAGAAQAEAAQPRPALPLSELDWMSTEFGRHLASHDVAEAVAAYPHLARAIKLNATTPDGAVSPALLSTQLGLPDSTSTVDELVGALEASASADSPAAAEFPTAADFPTAEVDSPYLELEPGAGKLYVVLPVLEGEDPHWLVDTVFDSFQIPADAASVREIARSPRRSGASENALRINIVQPTAKITATRTTDGKKFRLPVLNPDFPAVFFTPEMGVVPNQSRITTMSALVLAPTGTRFSAVAAEADPDIQADAALDFNAAELNAANEATGAADTTAADANAAGSAAGSDAGSNDGPDDRSAAGGTTHAITPAELGPPIAPADELKFTSWPEWSVFELDNLVDYETIALTWGAPKQQAKQVTTRQVAIGNDRMPVWLAGTGQIPSAYGTDGRPVYKSSPQLVLPHDAAATWTIELYYIDPESGRELVEELVELAPFQGQPLALFDDVYEDAWVGHYEVDILRDGELVHRSTVNMAEGFDLHITYTGGSGADFRHPDKQADANAYTKAYYAQRRAAAKDIDVPFSKPQAIARDEISSSFQISNAVDYALDVVAKPNTLEYSLDQRGEQPDWDRFPGVVALGSLSKNGEFKVRFPGGIGGSAALLLTHEVSRKVKVVPLKRKRHGTVFTATNASIRHAFSDAHATIIASVAWHPHDAETTFAALSDTEAAAYASSDEFLKAYSAHATPDVTLATLARLTEPAPALTGTITGDTLQLSPNTKANADNAISSTAWAVFLWPLTRPDIQPWFAPAEKTPAGSPLTFRLPDELHTAGPLIIDVVESAPGYTPKTPGRPSFHAFVVDQPGYFNHFGGAQLARKFSVENDSEVIGKQEQPALWRHLYALRNVHGPATDHIAAVIRKTVNADPRHLIEALGRSNVRVADQPALAVYHGLVNYDFHHNDAREVTFRATPWVRLLEQLNDVHDGLLTNPAEREDATEFILTAGGPALPTLLSGAEDQESIGTRATQTIVREVLTAAKDDALSDALVALNDISGARGIADESALRHGWFELLRHRRKFEDIDNFVAFRKEMFAQEANILGEDLRRHLALLRKFGATYGQRQKNWWAWGPYLSAVAAHASRAAAAEAKGLSAYFTPLKSQHLKVWADIAQLAPTMTAYDLVREEARQLGRARRA